MNIHCLSQANVSIFGLLHYCPLTEHSHPSTQVYNLYFSIKHSYFVHLTFLYFNPRAPLTLCVCVCAHPFNNGLFVGHHEQHSPSSLGQYPVVVFGQCAAVELWRSTTKASCVWCPVDLCHEAWDEFCDAPREGIRVFRHTSNSISNMSCLYVQSLAIFYNCEIKKLRSFLLCCYFSSFLFLSIHLQANVPSPRCSLSKVREPDCRSLLVRRLFSCSYSIMDWME